MKLCTWKLWTLETLYLEVPEASNPGPGGAGGLKPYTWRLWRLQTMYLEALDAPQGIPGNPKPEP